MVVLEATVVGDTTADADGKNEPLTLPEGDGGGGGT
jgi:hypothetical protein